MSQSAQRLQENRRLIAYSAAAIYAGGALTSFVEALLPGGPEIDLVPGVAAIGVAALIAAVGPRLPRRALAPLGPIGVALIAYALATTPGPGDAAVLYMWPVLWTAFFFGTTGAVGIVACVGVAHGLALAALPGSDGYADRWVDVVSSVAVVAAVVHVLVRANDELLARLASEARVDKLTGLLNRRGFDEHAAVELAHARREQRALAIASFDIDHFKNINDEWGHDTGDRVLTRLGALLATSSRDIDVAARIGGEEFAVLLPGCTAADAEAFTQRIRQALAAPADDELPTVRVSAGVAAAAPPSTIEALLKDADWALYAAKRGGRNRTVSYDVRRAVAGAALAAR